ncbi:MAG: hypothetical protein ACLVML_04660 [Candidatus Gastranaerophilaceae bacterium]
MKTEDKFRFSLQFGADTEAKIRAGELLEQLGNKKSAVIVAALNDYMELHPELSTGALRISIDSENALRREKLEAMIRDIVREQLSHISIADSTAQELEAIPEAMEDDIAQMLNNLELFN